ncbi:MAG: hypothetical protein IPP19_12350 [Verrucomicrobia bacterium]|nr:hypothetical protein [Verrucomicrobiota bacterium]
MTQPEDEGSIGVNFGTAKISASLLKYCVGLRLLKLTGLEPWQPAQLTVEFLRSSSSGGQRLHWPDSWPIPDSPNPNQSDGKMYLNFEIKKLPEIEQLLQTNRRGEYSEIVAGGKNYLAEFRFHFPGEEAWRRAFPSFVDIDSFVQPVESPLRKPVVPRPALPTDALK